MSTIQKLPARNRWWQEFINVIQKSFAHGNATCSFGLANSFRPINNDGHCP
jgi:hypothetical protein